MNNCKIPGGYILAADSTTVSKLVYTQALTQLMFY